ncbi:MAG: hypothetical protein L0Z53_19270 [Acidobacteriales bacterium]|nr:hypothetical protein [Terriglobales bacterium]
MTSRELREWELFYAIEPFGEKRDDVNSARLLYMLVKLLGSRRSKPKVQEFVIDWWSDKQKQQSAGEQIAICQMIAAAYEAANSERGN